MEIFNISAQFSRYAFPLIQLGVGIIFIYHGLPKIIKLGQTSKMMQMPLTAVLILGLVETLGGIGLIFGSTFFIRFSALLLAIVMIGAIFFKIRKFKTPFSSGQTTGWEFDFILLIANIAILIK
ncbi:MAG: hypothetical protein COV31_01265 [Candidatus Yanofskybacteria bacterium CG10_big_fil_rev_8_21_14_0_10_46_23]|uniref:DoxX family protein n=1 Tax=Candidatus Yanofskybacteria bacterium CG10_big_fil_rev_8_21_14_0_10_46_23 TaxID=1975098 RepID=A0A2H0R4N1_9BACT|nr:MAG: hypothetical protein COV31_01265 [Candidatus Yanofskybacteria bacterium CG10_big_fil_rev_8_21_14_0_10_46_23]